MPRHPFTAPASPPKALYRPNLSAGHALDWVCARASRGGAPWTQASVYAAGQTLRPLGSIQLGRLHLDRPWWPTCRLLAGLVSHHQTLQHELANVRTEAVQKSHLNKQLRHALEHRGAPGAPALVRNDSLHIVSIIQHAAGQAPVLQCMAGGGRGSGSAAINCESSHRLAVGRAAAAVRLAGRHDCWTPCEWIPLTPAGALQRTVRGAAAAAVESLTAAPTAGAKAPSMVTQCCPLLDCARCMPASASVACSGSLVNSCFGGVQVPAAAQQGTCLSLTPCELSVPCLLLPAMARAWGRTGGVLATSPVATGFCLLATPASCNCATSCCAPCWKELSSLSAVAKLTLLSVQHR